MDPLQWRIQDFPKVEAPTLGRGGGANIQFLPNLPPKTARNWKNLDPGEDTGPKFYYVDPPLIYYIPTKVLLLHF